MDEMFCYESNGHVQLYLIFLYCFWFFCANSWRLLFKVRAAKSVRDSLFPGCLSPVSDVLQGSADDDNDGDYSNTDDGDNEQWWCYGVGE